MKKSKTKQKQNTTVKTVQDKKQTLANKTKQNCKKWRKKTLTLQILL